MLMVVRELKLVPKVLKKIYERKEKKIPILIKMREFNN